MKKKITVIVLVLLMNLTSSLAFAGNEEDIPRMYLVDVGTETGAITATE